jgi:hypothetical protein
MTKNAGKQQEYSTSGVGGGGGARVGADVGASGGGGRGGAQADAGVNVFSVTQIYRAHRNASHTRNSAHPFSIEIGIGNFDHDLRLIKFRLILEQRQGTNGAFVDVSKDLKIEPTRRCSFEPDSDHAQVSERERGGLGGGGSSKSKNGAGGRGGAVVLIPPYRPLALCHAPSPVLYTPSPTHSFSSTLRLLYMSRTL